MLLGGEVAAAEEFADQDREPNLDLIEPRGVLGREVEGDAVTGIAQECLACRHRLEDAGFPRRSCAKSPVAVRFRRCPGRLPPGGRSERVPPTSVALSAPAPDRSVPVHAQPTVAPVKPCEPARYPPLQIERIDSHHRRIHAYGLGPREFVWRETVTDATRFSVADQPSRQFQRGVLVTSAYAHKTPRFRGDSD